MKRLAWRLLLVVVAVVGVLAILVLVDRVTTTSAPVVMSPETTWIVAPLRPDGHPDYVAALNEFNGKGTTPQNNAAVLLLRAMGPKPFESAEACRETAAALGVPPPPEKGDYLIEYRRWCEIQAPEALKAPPSATPLEETPKPPADAQMARAEEGPWSKEQCPLVAAWLAANEKPLALVVEASRRPRLYVPTTATMIIYSPARFLSLVRQAGRLLSVRAMLRLQEGNAQQAWDDLQAIRRLAALTDQQSGTLDLLVAATLDTTGLTGQGRVARLGKLSTEQLRRFAEDLRAGPPLSLADKLDRGQRMLVLEAICAAARNEPGIERLLECPASEFRGADWNEVLRRFNARFDESVAVARQPRSPARAARVEAADAALAVRIAEIRGTGSGLLQELRRRVSPQPTDHIEAVLLQGFYSVIHPVLDTADRALAARRIAQLVLALEAYRRQHGQYPDTLGALAPDYLDKVPEDLFAYSPFHYRREGNGYVLYSVGPNGKDDGGQGRWMEPIDENASSDLDDIGLRTGDAAKPAAKPKPGP